MQETLFNSCLNVKKTNKFKEKRIQPTSPECFAMDLYLSQVLTPNLISAHFFFSHNSKAIKIRSTMDFNWKVLQLAERILTKTVINLRRVSRIMFGHVFMSVLQ